MIKLANAQLWVHDKDETPAGPPDAWRKNPA